MPELPEVETIATQLNNVLSGKHIVKMEVLNQKSFFGESGDIVGQKIIKVNRKGKTLIVSFGDNLYMLVHLKMTGQLIFVDGKKRIAGGHPSHDFHASLPNQHTRIIFDIDNGSRLFFNDLRKFGWVKVMTVDGCRDYFAKYGPEALPEIDISYIHTRAKRMPKSTIKRFILDQSIISGVGNIYADEALFEARISPNRLVSSLTDNEWTVLMTAIVEKLNFAISKGGTTDSDYVDALGEKGGMQDYLNVYHKAGTRCPRRCGGVIARTVVAGRGTHYCPVCQKDAS